MPGIPICVFAPSVGMFRVLHAKGKCFASGGYGVHVAENRDPSKVDDTAGNKHAGQDTIRDMKQQPSSCEHLFIEEALFLHERGLLQVLSEDGSETLDSSTLFARLSHLGVSPAIYLTYAHLRAQTFIVVRHTKQRLHLLNKMAQATGADVALDEDATKGNGEEDNTTRKKRKRHGMTVELQRQIRQDAISAPPPAMMISKGNEIEAGRWGSCGNAHDDACSINDAIPLSTQVTRDGVVPPIAFDVYQPNSAFRKTNPGPPDFCVAVTAYSEPSPPFHDLCALLDACHGIPLRLATVADGGAVIMFGLTDTGVPSIKASDP